MSSTYTLYSKTENHLFVQPVHLRSTRTIISERDNISSRDPHHLDLRAEFSLLMENT